MLATDLRTYGQPRNRRVGCQYSARAATWASPEARPAMPITRWTCSSDDKRFLNAFESIIKVDQSAWWNATSHAWPS